MKLLLTVARPAEVETALRAGADLVDVKDPGRGSLGRPSAGLVDEVARRCAGRRPVSVALGDGPHDAGDLRRAARGILRSGPAYLKVGLATDPGPAARAAGPVRPAGGGAPLPEDGAGPPDRALEAVAGAIASAHAGARLVAVTFADARPGRAPSPEEATRRAHRQGADAVMLDTLSKVGGSTPEVMGLRRLARWVAEARGLGLETAVAGGLDAASIRRLGGLGVDVVGVRGGACDGGREGRLDLRRCRALRGAVDAASARSTRAG